MAKLEGQSIASSYEQLLHVDRDGGGNGTTHVAVKDGKNDNTFALTLATDAVMITSTNRLEFGDDGTYIHQSADGVLDLVSDTEIEVNATTIDMNGALDLSGNATIGGSVAIGASVGSFKLEVSGGDIGFFKTVSAGSGINNLLTIAATDGGVNMGGGEGAGILFKIPDDETNPSIGAQIGAIKESADDSISSTALIFSTSQNDETLDEAMRINSSGNIGVGVSPDTTMHIHKATAGTVDSNANAVLTIENNTHAGIQFLTPNDANAIIYFGDVDDNDISYIGYLHSTNDLQFYINGGVRLQLDNNSRISLSNNDGGSDNTVFGKLAGNALTTNGDENVLIGHEAGNDMTTGERNVVIGYQAGDAMTIATRSVAIGYGALSTEDVGDRSIAIGFNSLYSQNSDSNNETTGNVGIGVEAGFYNQTGQHNTLIGAGAGMGASTQSNSNNTAVGYASLNVVTTGGQNTAVGKNSGDSLTDGTYNTFLGYYAGATTTSATRTVAIGTEAMESGNVTSAAEGAIAIGSKALHDLTSAQRMTAVGFEALALEDAGSYQTAVGYQALAQVNNDNGHNTALGQRAGYAITTGNANTLIGSGAEASANSGVNQTVIGQGATGQADNSVTLGNASVTDVYMAQDSGATVHADYVLSRGNSNHVASSMSAPYYRFDGADDYISLNNGVDTSQFSFGTKASFSFWVRMPNSSFDAAHTVIGKWHTSSKREYLIFFSDSEQLSFVASSNGANATTVSSPALTGLATWNHFAVTYNAGAVVIYRNGVSIATGTSESSMYNSAEPLFLGGNEGGTSNDFYGELACVRLYNNVLTADEVKDESSGASVPYKYKGASTTSLVTGTDSTMDGSNNWAAGGGLGSITANYSADSRNVLRLVTDDGGANDRGVLAVTAVKGARYRIQYDYKAVQGNKGRIIWAGYDSGNQQLTSTSFATVTSEFTSNFDGSVELTIYPSRADGPTGGSANDELLIDNLTLVRIGAVAEYDGSGIASDKWFDKSGNDLHGAVNGPTVENAPSDDDGLVYEDGTWTPLPADASSSGNTAAAGTATGYYTRIGRMVHCEFTLVNINTTGMTSGNDFFVQGLPYTVANHAGHAHGSVALENVNFTGEYVTISPAGGTTAIRFAEVPDNGNIDIVMVSEINDDSADIYGHFSYMAT